MPAKRNMQAIALLFISVLTNSPALKKHIGDNNRVLIVINSLCCSSFMLIKRPIKKNIANNPHTKKDQKRVKVESSVLFSLNNRVSITGVSTVINANMVFALLNINYPLIILTCNTASFIFYLLVSLVSFFFSHLIEHGVCLVAIIITLSRRARHIWFKNFAKSAVSGILN